MPSCGRMEMFADDTTLYCIDNSIDDVCSKIQNSISEVVKWCNRDVITIHPSKTGVMILTRKDFTGPLKPIQLGDQVISFVDKSHLSWDGSRLIIS